MTNVILEHLEDSDVPESEEDEPAGTNDPDYVPNLHFNDRRGRQRERVQLPTYIKTPGAKRKFVRAVRAGTFKAAVGLIDPPATGYTGRLTPHNVRYKHFGFLGSEECTECNALFYKTEGIKSTTQPGYLQCCQHGKVKVEPPVIPDLIKRLLDPKNKLHKEFLKNIRTYNNYFAMASFQGRFVNLEKNFPHVVKLHGQIQVLLNHVEPKDYEPRSARVQKIMKSQMFFVDPSDAKKSRDAYEPNRRLDPDTVLKLNKLLSEVNVLYQSFDRMAAILKKAKREWARNNDGEMPPNIKLVFKRRANDPSRILFRPTGATYEDLRYEEPVEGGNTEIAAVFDSNHRPTNVPLWVSQHGKPVKLGPRNPLREPLLYPLMYPDGKPMWYQDDAHRRDQTAVQNKITIRQYYSFMLHLRRKKYLQRMYGALTQQWIVEGWVRVEDSDLDYIKNLDYLRVSTRPNLTKFLNTLAEREGMDLGREIKLPSSFSHSPAQMQRYYMNSIQMVRVSQI